MSAGRDGQSSGGGGSRGGAPTPGSGASSKSTGWSRSPKETVTFDQFMESKIRKPDPLTRLAGPNSAGTSNSGPNSAGTGPSLINRGGQYDAGQYNNNNAGPNATGQYNADQSITNTPTGRFEGRLVGPPPMTVHFAPPGVAHSTTSSAASSAAGAGGTRHSVTNKMRTPAVEFDTPSGRYVPKGPGTSPAGGKGAETAKYHVGATTQIYVGEPGGAPVTGQHQNAPSAATQRSSSPSKKGKSPTRLSSIQQFDRDLCAELKKYYDEQAPTPRQIALLKSAKGSAAKDEAKGDSPAAETYISPALKSTLSGCEIDKLLRPLPDEGLADAVDMYLRAEAAMHYAGAVRAAEEAAALVPPELAEEAAAAGARGYQARITQSLYKTIEEKTSSTGSTPIEVVGYIGMTTPTTT